MNNNIVKEAADILEDSMWPKHAQAVRELQDQITKLQAAIDKHNETFVGTMYEVIYE